MISDAVPIADLSPAYGGPEWADVVGQMVADPIEADTVRALREVIDAGMTLAPVVVDRATGKIVDGMHRVVAALLTGRDSVTTTSDHPTNGREYLEVRIAFDPSGESLGRDDTVELVSSVLRSFPLPDGTWLVSDVIAWEGTTAQCWYTLPHDRAAQLIEYLPTRGARYGLRFRVLSVEPGLYDVD